MHVHTHVHKWEESKERMFDWYRMKFEFEQNVGDIDNDEAGEFYDGDHGNISYRMNETKTMFIMVTNRF